MTYTPEFHIVLHNPEIPPNTGAVGRTCVALKAKLWLVRPLGFRIDEKTLRRAGLDYWQFLHWEVADHWEDLQHRLNAAEIDPSRFWMFSRFASRDFRSADFRHGDVLIFGSETAGLPTALTEKNPDQLLRIPVGQHVRSLNLSAAVAVAGYEAQRQLIETP